MKTQLVDLARSLFERGYVAGGAGNMSCRLESGTIAATPGGSSFGRLRPDILSVVDDHGRPLDGPPPTKELPLHLALYRADSQCRAVVHLHSTFATALACLEAPGGEADLPALTPYYVMRVGRLPVVPYHAPGSPALVRAVETAAASALAMLLANHGSLVGGPNLAETVNNAEELEETAKLFFLLRPYGGMVRSLTPAEVAGLRQGAA